jgi:hypothetical protein
LNGDSVGGDEDLDLGHDIGQASNFRVIFQKSQISQRSSIFYISPPPKKTTSGAVFIFTTA